MKKFRKMFSAVLVFALMFYMMGCSQSPAINTPPPHVNTIYENIELLTRNSHLPVKSKKFYYVDKITDKKVNITISEPGDSVNVSNVSGVQLHRVSNFNEKINFWGDIFYPGSNEIKIGQMCCLLTFEDTVGYTISVLVFGN